MQEVRQEHPITEGSGEQWGQGWEVRFGDGVDEGAKGYLAEVEADDDANAEDEMSYYELRDTIHTPTVHVFKGARKTKEEWLAMNIGFEDEHFGCFSSWFREVEDPVIEIDLCTNIIANLLSIPSSCSPNALRETEMRLREMEANSTDIAKAYGLRCAADIIHGYAENAQYPTREQLRAEVRAAYEPYHK